MRAAGPKRRAISARARVGGAEHETRSPKALAISVLLHLAVAVVVLQLLTFGHGLTGFLDFGKEEKLEERLTFVATRPPTPEPVRPVRPVPSAERPVAPGTTLPGPPVAVPETPPPAARADTGSGEARGTGNGVGALNPNLQGVKPSFDDPRVWQGPTGNGVAPSRNGIEMLDSIIAWSINMGRDSVDSIARAHGLDGRAPGDWTTKDKNGNKWGWDNAGIRLGKVVIPNALLGLLPLNAQVGMSGNPTDIANERRLALSRADILRMSERSMGEAEFKKLASELRDRREKERRERLKAPSASIAPAPVLQNPPKDR